MSAAAGLSWYLVEVRNRSRDRFVNLCPLWGERELCSRRASCSSSCLVELDDLPLERLGNGVLLLGVAAEPHEREETIRLASMDGKQTQCRTLRDVVIYDAPISSSALL